jgi:hypothetical protein
MQLEIKKGGGGIVSPYKLAANGGGGIPDGFDIIDPEQHTYRDPIETEGPMTTNELRAFYQGGAEAIRRLFVEVEASLTYRDPSRRVRGLSMRVVAIGIRSGALTITWEKAAEIFGTSRQNLHLISNRLAREIGLSDQRDAALSRNGKAAAKATAIKVAKRKAQRKSENMTGTE